MTEPEDFWAADQMVPAGYQRLADLRDRDGPDAVLRGLQTGTIVSFEYRPDDGHLIAVPVEDWRSRYSMSMLRSGLKQHYFSPELPDDPANPREVYSYGQDQRLLLVRLDQPSSGTVAAPNKGGAPTKYDWAAAAGHLAGYVVEHDYPGTQDGLAQVLTEWFRAKGQVPDGRDLQKFVSSMYQTRVRKT